MAEIWKPQPIITYMEWANAIMEEASDKLNDWENTFIDSINEKLERGYNLTQAQAEKLESIYTKYTS